MTQFEQNILIGCKNGDDNCWRQLFSNYYPLAKWVVTHTIYHIDDLTVNCLAQDAMIVLVENIRKITDEQYLKRFIKRVTRNKCIDFIRKHREVFEEVPEDIPDILDDDLDDTVVDALHEAVNELKEPCNTIIRERFLDGLSYKEIASSLDIDVGQLGVRISRCLGFLRKALENMGIFSWEKVL